MKILNIVGPIVSLLTVVGVIFLLGQNNKRRFNRQTSADLIMIASSWQVTNVEIYKGQAPNMAYYKLISNDTTALNSSDTWIVDTVGKFNPGDTLIFTKK